MEEQFTPRPRHHHKRPQTDNHLALRNVLNIAFMLLAVAAIVIWLALPMPKYQLLFVVCAMIAVLLKVVEVCIRIFSKKQEENE